VLSTRERALAVLLDPALAPIVDIVLSSPSRDVYEAATADGSVRFRRDHDSFTVDAVVGDDPFADQATDRLVGLDAELADPHPPRKRNSYPYAHEQVAQLFDHPAAPDLCVLHTAAHNWEAEGGHRGEHGSLGVVQARAPFVIAGAGARAEGVVPRSGRLVDVAPTICALLGVEARDDGTFLRGEDGAVLADVLDPATRPRHVVGFLLDGVNPNVLHARAARGDTPNLARLIAGGTSYEHGAIAGMPTVTLANHTSILTGRYPGHHGILHNAWYDRRTGEQIVTNSQATWPWSMQHCLPGVESIHDAVHRTWPTAFTASVNEPCDIGANYSTFDFFRAGTVPPIPETADGIPHATERFVRPHKDYAWSTVVDHMGTEQAVGIWSGHYRDVRYPRPTLMWCNFTLTDSAFHIGGPHSEIADASLRDTDARVGEIVSAVEEAGASDDTAFVVVSDHGMQQTDPTVTGDWDVALRDAGIRFRDEGYGFLYLDED
jgi:phosphonoacetate hydrolase